jgi:molybdopterin molybdotransferase
MGTLASLGKAFIKVYRKPNVAIISTGNEIKKVSEAILPYHIRDSNTYSTTGFFYNYHITPAYKEIIPDDKEKLRAGIEKALEADILILSGGVSMGDADFIPEILQELGVKKIFHKIQIKPGKPLWFGKTESTVVFALPGNPFSVQVAFKIFIEPYLRACMGMKQIIPLKLPIAGNKKKKTSFDEYFPCKISSLNQTRIQSVAFNGSGDIRAAIESDGIALHPSAQGDISEGEFMEFLFWDKSN